MKSPILLLKSLFISMKRLMPDVKGFDRDFTTAEVRFNGEGCGFLTVALPSIGAALDRGLRDGTFICPTGFARIRKGALPRFLSGLLERIFEPSTGRLKERPCEESIKSARELTFLFKKLVYSDRREALLHTRAVEQFWQVDNSSETITSDSRMIDILTRVCNLLFRSNLDSIEFDKLRYRHGPGAVAENVKGNQKWSLLYQSLDAFDSGLTGHSLHIVRSEEELVYQSMFRSSDCSRSESAKLITVLKNSTSRRTITAEPLVKQFVQQGLNKALREEILRCPILNQCLALSDQSKNQFLALLGSISGKWSTLDLSSASDRLSLKLVEMVFARHPRFLQAMIDCRSPSCKSDGVTRSMKKFAGMGNALTFPVQSIAFTAICIAAMCDQLGLNPVYWTVRRLAKCIRVYGDDIIIRTEYYDRVVNWIESFGLKVNVNKSFGTGKFRESCGVDAYNGVNVTPLYLRTLSDKSSTAEEIAHHVALSNHFWLRGHYEPANLLSNWVEAELKFKLPLVANTSGLLGWHTRQNAKDFQRWDPKLHRFLVRSYAPSPQKRVDKIGGMPALFKFFHTSLIERRPGHLKETVVRYSTKLVKRWQSRDCTLDVPTSPSSFHRNLLREDLGSVGLSFTNLVELLG